MLFSIHFVKRFVKRYQYFTPWPPPPYILTLFFLHDDCGCQSLCFSILPPPPLNVTRHKKHQRNGYFSSRCKEFTHPSARAL